jgi:hypothetical protein
LILKKMVKLICFGFQPLKSVSDRTQRLLHQL